MNERDIPSVPITTLAGVASLTDCEYQLEHNIYVNQLSICIHLPTYLKKNNKCTGYNDK